MMFTLDWLRNASMILASFSCLQALSPLMDKGVLDHGAFNPACFIHTSFSPQAPLINGLN